ncbi:MAG TPA: hypothetical protein VH933_11615 [Aestuariivirgaceae bacterium]|jgi:hypothetical protein
MKSVRHHNDERKTSGRQQWAAAENATNLFALAARWQQELLRFGELRLSRYVEHAGRLCDCRSATDLVAAQAGFLQQMISDYRSEADLFFLKVPNAASLDTSPLADSYESTILKAQEDAAQIIDLAKQQARRILGEAAHQSSSAISATARRKRANKG